MGVPYKNISLYEGNSNVLFSDYVSLFLVHFASDQVSRELLILLVRWKRLILFVDAGKLNYVYWFWKG